MKTRGFLVVLLHSLLLAAAADAGTLVQFRTTLGDMVIELYDRDKPVTVANFLRYVYAGRYTNIFFHRCITNFVVQGGGCAIADPASTNPMTVYIPVSAYDAITNEFGVGPRYSNVYGTIAMAKTTNSPDTATCQWFFNLADNSANLDNQNGGFTVFGRVLRGTNVLEQFNSRSMWNGIVNLDGGLFSTLPVTYSGMVWPHYNELIYVTVEPLSVGIRAAAGGECTLSWAGVAGMTNIAEYADNLSPDSWHPLLSTNPAGGVLNVSDPMAGATSRVYRIRVE